MTMSKGYLPVHWCVWCALMRIGKYRQMANPNHDDCTQTMMITIMMTASYMEDDVDNVPPHRTCIDYIRYSKFCHGCDVKPHLSSLSASPPSALWSVKLKCISVALELCALLRLAYCWHPTLHCNLMFGNPPRLLCTLIRLTYCLWSKALKQRLEKWFFFFFQKKEFQK